MNTRTRLSPTGEVTIPQDVRDRLAWEPGTPLELVETPDGITLRRGKASPFPRKTLADLDALPGSAGPPQPIEAISRLSNDDILRLIP